MCVADKMPTAEITYCVRAAPAIFRLHIPAVRLCIERRGFDPRVEMNIFLQIEFVRDVVHVTQRSLADAEKCSDHCHSSQQLF